MDQAVVPGFEPNVRTARNSLSFSAPKPALSDRNRPLVVDLEGALLCKNLLAEGIRVLVRRNLLMVFPLLFWLVKGRAVLKREVLARAALDLTKMPFNADFMRYVRGQSAMGREIVLAATVSESEATALLRRFPVFERAVLFNDSLEGLGDKRAERLLACFPRGFHYAGGTMPDLPIWEAADHIILVNPSRNVARAARMQGRAITQFPQPEALMLRAASRRVNRALDDEDAALLGNRQALALVALSLVLAGAQLAEPAALSSIQLTAPMAMAAALAWVLTGRRGSGGARVSFLLAASLAISVVGISSAGVMLMLA